MEQVLRYACKSVSLLCFSSFFCFPLLLYVFFAHLHLAEFNSHSMVCFYKRATSRMNFAYTKGERGHGFLDLFQSRFIHNLIPSQIFFYVLVNHSPLIAKSCIEALSFLFKSPSNSLFLSVKLICFFVSCFHFFISSSFSKLISDIHRL
jgi:hypothetical protein